MHLILINVTQSGYSEYQPKFSSNGKLLLYATNRFGERGHGSDGSEADVFGLYLNQEAFDEAHLSKAELALKKKRAKKKKEREDKEKTEKGKKDEPSETPGEKEADLVLGAVSHVKRVTLSSATPRAGQHTGEKKENEKEKSNADPAEKKSKKKNKDKKKVEPIEFELEDRDQRLKRMTLMFLV